MLARILKRLGSIKTPQALLTDLRGYVNAPRYTMETSPSDHLSAYPMRMENAYDQDPYYFDPLDASGVPVFIPDETTRAYIPSRIAGYALSQWNMGRLDPDQAPSHFSRAFLNAAQWFVNSDDGCYRCDFTAGDLKGPWMSCLSQGLALSVLVRAYRLTGEQRYLDVAQRAAKPLGVSVASGGVASTLPNGAPFIEEYPNSRHTHVLNGALTAILGLDEYVAIAGDDSAAAQLRDTLLRSVAQNCRLWSTGRWTAYGIERGRFGTVNACTVNYQLIHIALLNRLSRVSPGYPELSRFADELREGLASPAERLIAFAKKTSYRIANGF